MLKIWLGDFQKDCVKNPDRYFDMHREKDWFNRTDVKKIIKEIDDVDAIEDEYMVSDIFGAISPESLSTGCKALILMYINPLLNVYASRCGDNCAKAILDLAKKTDVVITLHHMMIFPSDFEAQILDTGKIIHSRKEFAEEFILSRI